MPKIVRYTPAEWKQFSQDAHAAVFGKVKPPSFDRIDYALLYVTDDETPAAYITVRELDHQTVYWQFGGAFPWAWKSTRILPMLDALLEYQGKLSTRMVTYVENTNFPMLKVYLSRKLQVIGTRNVLGTVLVELLKEW